MGGLFQLFWRRGRDFQELGYCPPFGLLWLAAELSWRLLGVLLNLLMCYNTRVHAQGRLVKHLSAILNLVCSNQFMSCPQQLCQVAPDSFLSHKRQNLVGDFCFPYRADQVLTHTQISSLPKLQFAFLCNALMSLFPQNEVFSSVDVRGTSTGAKELVLESSLDPTFLSWSIEM